MQVLAFLFALLSVTNISLVVRAQDVDPGRSEYLAHCASCHGIDGRGSKPIGGQQPKPADLTLLTKRSGGVFLSSAVFEMIDGRRAIRSHHNSMPIWGCRYASDPVFKRRKIRGYQSKPLESILNLSCDAEEVIRQRIEAVVGYLERIQQK
jgi:mono/diheme cytochrome c family protein